MAARQAWSPQFTGYRTVSYSVKKAPFEMDRPLPLITPGDDGRRFVINEEAKACLEKIDKPVSVVAIVGKYRTGKSYLINRLSGKTSGFDVGCKVQTTTKGIWMWVRPHPRDSNRCLLLIDTEGLRNVKKGDTTNDIQLFTLAVLLCNCFVYNSQGTIDDDAIKRLHLVTELTEHIKIHAGSTEKESGDFFYKYFPQFIWVVRDFILQLNIGGKPCTPDGYLEHALRLKRGQSKAARDYNAPTKCIREFFPHRKCFVFKRPVDDDELLQKLDTTREEDFKPQFLEDVKKFCEEIWTRVDAFQVQGNIINGSSKQS